MTPEQTRVTEGSDQRSLDLRRSLLLSAALLCFSGLVIHPWSAQPASRYLLTVAALDDQTLHLDQYEAYLGIDQATFDGHVYSDKAPYQPFAAVPAFWLYRVAGGKSFPQGFSDRNFDVAPNYGLWVVTFASATLPGVGLLLLIERAVRRTHPDVSVPVATAIVFGTTVLPFTGWLFGHLLAALCVMAAWYLVRFPGPSERVRALGAGAAIGIGVGTEYTVALIALILGIYLLLERRWRFASTMTIAAAAALLPLLLYNHAVFGSPFETAYHGNLKSFEGEGALGVYNLQVPQLDELNKALFSSRGLFVLTPIVLVAVVAAVRSVVRRTERRPDSLIALLALVTFAFISVGVDGLGGDSPGPRYLIPAIPLLAVPLAEAWQSHGRICLIAACFGGTWMWVATATNPAVDTSHPEPLRTWMRQLLDGDLAVNVLTGTSSLAVLVSAAMAGLVMLRLARHTPPS